MFSVYNEFVLFLMTGRTHQNAFALLSVSMEIRLLTFVATNAIINPRQAAILIAMRSPETSASHPMTGGPTKKPKKLMLDTMVMAMLALTVPNLPAML